MLNLISSFAHYAGRTADKMGVPPEAATVRACVDLMFNVLLESKAEKIKNPLGKFKYAEEKTAEWISPRYESYKKYAHDFFKGVPNADHDAVIVAMLCAGYTDYANVPAGGHEDSTIPTVFKNESLDFDLVRRAEALLDEAQIITDKVLGQDEDFKGQDTENEPKLESVFLTHGFLSDQLYMASADEYAGCEKAELKNIIDNFLSPIRAFAHSYTVFGREIIDHADHIQEYLEAMMGPENEPASASPVVEASRPRLTLVPNPL